MLGRRGIIAPRPMSPPALIFPVALRTSRPAQPHPSPTRQRSAAVLVGLTGERLEAQGPSETGVNARHERRSQCPTAELIQEHKVMLNDEVVATVAEVGVWRNH